MAPDPILEVIDQGRRIGFTFAAMLDYAGPGSPAGVAHAFKVLQRGLPLMDGGNPPERRELRVHTAFGGPGARDGIELVTRAVSEHRFRIDGALARPERGRALERFVFRLSYRESAVTLVVRDGFVLKEMIELARREHRSPDEEARLDALKLEMAELVMAAPANAVYDVEA